jgi:hypothetical protein
VTDNLKASAWSRPLLWLISGLMDGKSRIEIADELATDRFKVARMIKSLHDLIRAA